MKADSKIYIAGHTGWWIGNTRKLKERGYQNLIYRTPRTDLTNQQAVQIFLREKPDMFSRCSKVAVSGKQHLSRQFIYKT